MVLVLQSLKCAQVVLIYKNRPDGLVHYLQTLVTPPPTSKIYKKCLVYHLYTYIKQNHILFSLQYEFMAGLST